MTKDDFKEILGWLHAHYHRERKLEDGLAVINSSYTILETCPELEKAARMLINNAFGELAYDTVSWWLYEDFVNGIEKLKAKDKKPHMWDKNKKPIKLITVDDLYDYLEGEQCKKK